jgi:hypothetical protein
VSPTCSTDTARSTRALVSLPGRERTEAEWRALFAAAGLALESMTRLRPLAVEYLIVGVPARYSPPPP